MAEDRIPWKILKWKGKRRGEFLEVDGRSIKRKDLFEENAIDKELWRQRQIFGVEGLFLNLLEVPCLKTHPGVFGYNGITQFYEPLKQACQFFMP